jgi:AcrR family transcriptional regulator
MKTSSKLASHFAETRILEAAMDVFSRRPASQVTVEDVLVAANISRRTFYKYFVSLESVVSALYELVTGKMVELIRPPSPDGAIDARTVHEAIDTYLDFHLTNGLLLRHLVEQAMLADSLLHPRRRWFENQLVSVLDGIVQNLDGRRLHPMVFRAMFAMLEGLTLRLLADDSKGADVATAKQVAKAFADQILGAPGVKPMKLPERAGNQ